ncbi:MAG: hypothetical protein ABIB46_01510 [bacterium]
MNNEKYEINLKNDIATIFEKIINDMNNKISLRVQSRAGAEISNIFEKKFVEYAKTNICTNITNAESFSEGATKNPFDIKFDYKFKGCEELIWGDIKAFNSKYEDSNPDIGTVNKVIKFMLNGHFYIVFILMEYTAHDEHSIYFEKYSDTNLHVKVELLKDIHTSFRLNPKNQLQVNYKVPFMYRDKKDFILLLEKKYKESFERQYVKAEKKLKEAEELFDKVKKIQNII